MKRVIDLKNDEELKAASWEAAKGAAYGASTVPIAHDPF
jgi:hypothetical protein